MNDRLTELLGAASLLAAVYCIGGLNGLWLAWSQPARMAHWAARVERVQLAINALEDRADGVPSDPAGWGGGGVPDRSSSSSEPSLGSGLGVSDVPARSTAAVLDQGEGPPAVTGNPPGRPAGFGPLEDAETGESPVTCGEFCGLVHDEILCDCVVGV